MSTCLFCRIVAGEIPATLVREEAGLLAFRDVNPQAPTHVLIVPREHIGSAAELTARDDALWGAMLRAAQAIAVEEGVSEAGYRLVANIGSEGGQTVPHLHLHLLGGRTMTWPPG